MNRLSRLSLHRLNEIANSMPGTAIDNRVYQSGEFLFKEDTYAKGLFFLDKGTLLINSAEQTGTEVVTSILGSNNFIGFLPLIQKTKHTSSAIAIEDNCRVKFISKAIVNTALADNRFAIGFMKILCERITTNENELVHTKTKSVDERLAMALVDLDHTFKKSNKESAPLIALKKKDLASLIGVAPETLSRRLADFENEGLIELHIKGIKVKDKKQLLIIADVTS